MQTRIDCHTHIVNPEIRDSFYARTNGAALVMQMLPSLMEDPACVQTVLSDPRLFLCPAIDIHSPIPEQLERIHPKLDAWKIVGLKIYLTYQKGRADDPVLFPVYDFASKHQLAVTFHTGLCSLVLPSDQDLDGSRVPYIAAAAERYPSVSFVAAHMGDPYLDECMEEVASLDNLYTDFSGVYETGTKEGSDIGGTILQYKQAIRRIPGMYRKILHGTDYCPPINLAQIDEYDQTIAAIFPPEERDAVYWKNCLRVFPRLTRLGWRPNL